MGKKVTQKEWIEKARLVHGDKYDYSKVDYIKSSEKVTIICDKHGEFQQVAGSHLVGRGCAICSGAKFDIADFIKKANIIHNDKYDYSKVEYISTNDKICIICPEHGEFWQTVSNHLKGQDGCKECRGKSEDFVVMNTFDDFILVANKKFNFYFDYTEVEYLGSRSKIKIICPEHGEFWQLPYGHVASKNGCPKCQDKFKYNTESFIIKANQIHKNKFLYNKSKYIGIIDNITITCPIHGDFVTTPSIHLSGCDCKLCFYDSMRLGAEEFIKRAEEVHGNFYDYSKVNYTNIDNHVTIICPEHGEFKQFANAHLKGCNCPTCARQNKVCSKGEFLIKDWLEKNKIKFKYQFELITEEIARKSNLMVIDFFVIYNNKQYFIEYDGKQHFEYIPFFFPTVEHFKRQQNRDKVLNEFCELYRDKVTLIRFKYNQTNEEIIDILDNEFNKNND